MRHFSWIGRSRPLLAVLAGLLGAFPSRGDSQRVGLGPEGARVVSVAVDPKTAGTVYIGTKTLTDEGFVYKSTDGGRTWRPAGDRTKARPPAPISLAVDPADSRIVYAGTYGDALYRSRDGGETWEVFPPGLNGATPRARLSVDPFSPGVVYVACNGFTKAVASPPGFVEIARGLPDIGQAIAADPQRPNVVFAGLNSGAVAKSTDGGITWKILKALPTLNPYWIMAIAIHPAKVGTLFVATFNGEVFGSSDDGASWKQVRLVPGNVFSAVNALAFDGSGNLFIGSDSLGLLKTTDGVVANPASTGLSSAVIYSLAFDKVGGSLYAGTKSGVFRSDDGGATWLACNRGLREINYGVSITPQPSHYVFARDSDTGLFRSADGGDTWKRIVPQENGRSTYVAGFAYDPARPSVLYVGFSFLNPDGSYGGGLYKSEDSGDTWRKLPLTASIYDIAVDLARPATVYVASYTGIYKSTDAGETWGAPTLTNANCYGVFAGPKGSSVVYAKDFIKNLYRSDDGGATWTTMNNGLELALQLYYVRSFAVDPVDRDTIYVSIDVLYRSRDGGRTWEIINRPGKMSGILPDPRRPTVLYAFLRDNGVFSLNGLAFSTDGGFHWNPLDTFSEWTDPGVGLALDPETGTLYASTWSNGVLALDVHSGRVRAPITAPCRPPCP